MPWRPLFPIAELEEPLVGDTFEPVEADDIRALWVAYDKHDRRNKDFVEAVMEMSLHHFSDWLFEFQISSLDLFRHMTEVGGNPCWRRDKFLRDRKMEENDRAAHEVTILCDALR